MNQNLEQESAEMRPHYTTASDLNIRLEPETATMSQSAFDSLHEYSLTLPSGKYLGKVWKCRRGARGWVLGEYTAADDPNMVGIVWREIVLEG